MPRNFLYPSRELPSRSLVQFVSTPKSCKRCEMYRLYKRVAKHICQSEATYVLPGFLTAALEREAYGHGDDMHLNGLGAKEPSNDDEKGEEDHGSNELSSSPGQGDYTINHYEEPDDLQGDDDDNDDLGVL